MEGSLSFLSMKEIPIEIGTISDNLSRKEKSPKGAHKKVNRVHGEKWAIAQELQVKQERVPTRKKVSSLVIEDPMILVSKSSKEGRG